MLPPGFGALKKTHQVSGLASGYYTLNSGQSTGTGGGGAVKAIHLSKLHHYPSTPPLWIIFTMLTDVETIRGMRPANSSVLGTRKTVFLKRAREVALYTSIAMAVNHWDDAHGQSFYRFTVIAKTGETLPGMSTITGLGWGPSINDSGTVAFVARDQAGREGVFVSDGESIQHRSALADQFDYNAVASVSDVSRAFTFGDVLQINNQDQVAYFIRSRDGLFAFVLRLGATAGDFRIVAKKYYPRLDRPELTAESPFLDLQPFVSLNNKVDGRARTVFSAVPRSAASTVVLATPRDTESSGHSFSGDFYISGPANGGPIFPMISDNNYTALRGGNSAASALLLMSDPTLCCAWFLAEAPAFAAIGERPSVSDDGLVVSFMGHKVNGGVGIFAENGVGVFKVAGLSGDGIVDPGETFDDLNANGVIDPGEDLGLFSSFAISPRVAVNRIESSSSHWCTLAYVATRRVSDGPPQSHPVGLYLTRVDNADPANPEPAPPLIVAEVGGEIPNLPGQIQEIRFNDGINNSEELVFWVRTTEVEAIVRADHCCCDTNTRIVDSVGTDYLPTCYNGTPTQSSHIPWTDDVGNRLEIFCVSMGPGNQYQLLFTRVGCQPIVVGECIFDGGCNSWDFYHSGDNDKNGKPDCFLRTSWFSHDQDLRCGDLSDDPIDADTHFVSFDILRNRQFVYDWQRLHAEPRVRMSGPQLSSAVSRETFSAGVRAPQPIAINVTGRNGVADDQSCDVNTDGYCTESDQPLFIAEIGNCFGSANFNPGLDLDASGCINYRDFEMAGLGLPSTLKITRTGTNLIVSWSAWATNIVIEASETLEPAGAWTTISSVGQNDMTVKASGLHNFFRVRRY